jgi:hypothetical protein
MNISVKKALSLLTKFPKTTKKSTDKAAAEEDSENSDIEDDDPMEDTGCPRYAAALATDPIAKCRKMVSSCHASGQRCEDFELTISEGNESGVFCDRTGTTVVVPSLELLRDVDTRWSSIFLMIDRVLDLALVSSYLY